MIYIYDICIYNVFLTFSTSSLAASGSGKVSSFVNTLSVPTCDGDQE